MKRVLVYLLLLLFIFQSTSSLWIMASFYVNQKFISENICINRFDLIPLCNGACFLTKELKANDKKEQKIPNIKEKEIQLFCQQPDLYNITINIGMKCPKSILLHRSIKVKNPLLFCIYHPPEAA